MLQVIFKTSCITVRTCFSFNRGKRNPFPYQTEVLSTAGSEENDYTTKKRPNEKQLRWIISSLSRAVVGKFKRQLLNNLGKLILVLFGLTCRVQEKLSILVSANRITKMVVITTFLFFCKHETQFFVEVLTRRNSRTNMQRPLIQRPKAPGTVVTLSHNWPPTSGRENGTRGWKTTILKHVAFMSAVF